MDTHAKARAFAQQVQDLLNATLPVLESAPEEDRAVSCLFVADTYYAVHPGATTNATPIPLLCDGEHVASLRVSYHCTSDTDGTFLAVKKSGFDLIARNKGDNKAPLLRLDYDRGAHSVPAAHWNVHAERGAVSHLLARTNPKHSGMLSKVHLPVGGARGRPCLEDFLQMLFDEFQFDRLNGAQQAIDAGRADWRRTQIATMVRDAPDIAVHALHELGYTILEPEAGPRAVNSTALRRP
ncbi:hypothetical protein [Saccharopolyspora sp. CA-218241]|uniref:hypothetical protein n=1 Tax=Saccharopolyspora sp. CA-218241 TaxID=3240027 RepID=UPI003D983E29